MFFCFGCDSGNQALEKALSDADNVNDDSVSLAIESAINTVNSTLNDIEHIDSYAQLNKKNFSVFRSAYAASCNQSRFHPAIGSSCSGTDGNKTVKVQFNSCTIGSQEQFSLQGNAILSFDSSNTCNEWIKGVSLPESGSVLKTFSMVRLNPNFSKIQISSDSHQNYLGFSLKSGVQISFDKSKRTVNIFGARRIRIKANGESGFDHTITTPKALVITGSRNDNNRKIEGGEIRVDHNKAKYSLIGDLSGLTWNQNCCHPSSGTIRFQVSGEIKGELTLDFNTGTCGTIAFTDFTKDQHKIYLPSCE